MKLQGIARPHLLPWLVAGAGFAILLGAHIIEANGFPACNLCLRQRVPYWIGGGLALVAGIATLPRLGLPQWIPGLVMLAAALAFFVNMGFAIHHVGVEEGWWRYICTFADPNRPLIPCDDKRPFLFGLTLAAYNIFISLGLGLAALLAPWQIFRPKGSGKSAAASLQGKGNA